MEKLAPLEIFDATDSRFPGWSFIQPITTSHISGHYFEEVGKPSNIHMDVYSCKMFEWGKIFPILDDALKLGQWSANLIIRSVQISQQTQKMMSGKGANVTEVLDLAAPIIAELAIEDEKK
jgi:S-adenosylmethionine/arginine decarboxylase-like enzyme